MLIDILQLMLYKYYTLITREVSKRKLNGNASGKFVSLIKPEQDRVVSAPKSHAFVSGSALLLVLLLLIVTRLGPEIP